MFHQKLLKESVHIYRAWFSRTGPNKTSRAFQFCTCDYY